jgi:hypothetical protein
MNDANPVAASHHAGSLLLLVGISATYAFQAGELTGNATCPVTDPLTSNFTVPAQTGSYSQGDATLWLLIYANVTAVTESLLAVVGPTTYFLGTITGALCVEVSALPPLPATFVSSTSIASTVDADASSFLSAHGSANAIYALFENGTAGPEWGVVYTNCSYDPATGDVLGGPEGDLFAATVNGTNGLLTTSWNLAGQANCSALNLTSLAGESYELGMTEFSSIGAAGNFYDELALAPSSGLNTSLFGLAILSASDIVQPVGTPSAGCVYGATLAACSNSTGGWYGVILNSTDKVVATYGAFGWGDLAPASTSLSITAALTLVVVSGTQLAGNGYTIEAYPTGSVLVTGSALL